MQVKKINGSLKIHQANVNSKSKWQDIRVYFTAKCIKLNQECDFILTQVTFHREDLAVMNSYVLNINI